MLGRLTHTTGRQRREIVLRQRYGLLLLSLVVLFLVMGIAQDGPWQDALIMALAAATLVLALRAGDVTPRATAVVTVIGTAMMILVVVLAAAGISNDAAARISALALVAIAPPAVVVGVLRGLRERAARPSRRSWGSSASTC